MNKTSKVAKERLRDRDHERDARPTQKVAQSKNTAKMKEIMSTFSASKPTNVDAQRIVCILDSLIEKVQMLQFLDTDLYNTLNNNDKVKPQEKEEKEEILAQLTDETHILLFRELDLETKLKPLLGSGQENAADKTSDENNQTISLGEMMEKTSSNLRNLIRACQKEPADFELIKKLRRNSPLDDYEDFMTYLKGLRLLMLKRLSTSVEEQAAHDRQKEELEGKIAHWEKVKEEKEFGLRNLKKEKEKYISEKDEELNRLKNQIEEIEMNKTRQMIEIETESKRELDLMKKNFDEKEAQLLKQLRTLEEEMKEMRAKNKSEESNLRGKKTRVEDMLKDTLEQYDDLMDKREVEVRELESELQKIEKEIKDYQESLAILKKEEEKEKEIEKMIEKKKEYYQYEKDRINRIVQSIQDAWKIYKVKAKTTKKKGKKGGKDGKGGKDAKGGKGGKDAKGGKNTKR